LRNSLKIACCLDVSYEEGPTIDVCVVAVEETIDDKGRSCRLSIGGNDDNCDGKIISNGGSIKSSTAAPTRFLRRLRRGGGGAAARKH